MSSNANCEIVPMVEFNSKGEASMAVKVVAKINIPAGTKLVVANAKDDPTVWCKAPWCYHDECWEAKIKSAEAAATDHKFPCVACTKIDQAYRLCFGCKKLVTCSDKRRKVDLKMGSSGRYFAVHETCAEGAVQANRKLRLLKPADENWTF